MTSRVHSGNVQMAEPDLMAAAGPTRLNTTLYDVMSVLQAAVEPDKDNLVVAVIAHWIRSGRLSFPRRVVVTSEAGLTACDRLTRRSTWPIVGSAGLNS
jgi:hypothetical protein